MPKRSSNQPQDLNELAKSIVDKATSEDPIAQEPTTESPPESPPEKNEAAVSLGRLGGLKGGPARAKKLSQARRSEIAKKAAKVRWSKPADRSD